jgi:V/A-type H+-transporting ATPase subunit I
MFEVVWFMFFNELPLGDMTILKVLLIGGGTLIVLFTNPSPNPIKRIGIGALSSLMPIVNTFGDTLSYIRLMAVGLSGYYMASAFNGLAVKIFEAGWYWIWASILILIVAHSLNIFLCVIAVFAHGVRLNLLEFSSNCGVEWTGYPYAPFYNTLKKQGE